MSDAFRAGLPLQRLKSSLARLRHRARPAAARVSHRLEVALTRQVAALGSFLAEPELWDVWSRVRRASVDPSVFRDAAGYSQALWRGVKAPKGVPEVLAAGLGGVGLVFALQRGDLEELSELLGSMGVTAITSANPLLGLSLVASTGYAYWQAKSRGELLSLDRASAVRGAALAGSSAAVFTVLAGPAAVKLVVAITVTGVLRTLTVRAPSGAGAAQQGPVLAERVSPVFRCDRALVEAMLL